MRAGGHFAALEEPEALAADVRAFFRTLRAAAPLSPLWAIPADPPTGIGASCSMRGMMPPAADDQCRAPRMRSAAFSPIMIEAAFGLDAGKVGMIDESTTRNEDTP